MYLVRVTLHFRMIPNFSKKFKAGDINSLNFLVLLNITSFSITQKAHGTDKLVLEGMDVGI